MGEKQRDRSGRERIQVWERERETERKEYVRETERETGVRKKERER